MSAEQAEGILTPDSGGTQQPAEVARELSTPDANLNDLPPALREDQIQNAVAFLAHPKVKESSKQSKASFLERKGLTAAEIEEAFKRVPESSTAIAATPPAASTEPVRKPFPTGQALQPVTYITHPQQQQQSYRWTQVVIGASILAAGAYALKQLVGPYAVRCYRRLYGIQDEPVQGSDENKTAELLAAAIASQSTDLREAIESLKSAVLRLEKGKHLALPPAESSLSVSDLRAELHAFGTTLTSATEAGEEAAGMAAELKELKSLLAERLPSTSAATQKTSPAAYPAYLTGPVANGGSSVAPPAARFPYKSSKSTTQSLSGKQPDSQQLSYQEEAATPKVMEMLERGETPSNVRTDINDKPPNPGASPSASRQQPRPKPWERSHSPVLDGQPAGEASGVTITEVDDASSPVTPSSGAWRPPPVPQPSLSPQPPAELETREEAAEATRGADDD